MKVRDTGADTAQLQPAAAPRREAAPVRTPSGEADVQRFALQSDIDQSPRMLAQRRALQAMFGGAFQRKADGRQSPAPLPARADTTGIPNPLKAGIESLSGLDLSAVRVHRNSNKPAQLNALAYAQGHEIHIGPGHERHLPHEAWHVVQQARGRVNATRQLREEVALNDDPALEREADLMGQRALQIAAAPGGLATAPNSGLESRGVPRPAVRQQHRIVQSRTDPAALAKTIALPEFQFESDGTLTVEQLIDRRDQQMGGVTRDANKNNLVKRGFEEALATFVFHRWDLVEPVVLKVSKAVLEYFIKRVQVKKIALLKSMQDIQEEPNKLGSPGFMPESEEQGAKILLDQIHTSLPTHLNVHGKFSYVIYNGKENDFKDGTAEKIQSGAKDYFDMLFPPEVSGTYEGDPDRGRPRVPIKLEERAGLAKHLSGLAPDHTVEGEKLDVPTEIHERPTYSKQHHERGGDASFLDETKRWTQNARLLYDMPVMAGPSGSAAYMINTALVLGLPKEDLPTYAMALVGSIVGGGHHTFHEIMTVAAFVGVPYVPGDYLSAIPESFWGDSGFQDLLHRFFEPVKDFSERTRNDDSAPTQETSQQLQFGLPPVADDGKSMRLKIAAQLRVKPEDIAITPINNGSQTKGVSGSPVFRVTHQGRPIGVVKVFQQFAEMAQELSAMTTVNSLGLPNLVAPQVLGIGKLVKGRSGTLVKDKDLGYVFSGIAAGDSLDDLMQTVGTAQGGPREEAFEKLSSAVVAVATQLANLHNRYGSGGSVGAAFIKLHTGKILDYATKTADDEDVRAALDGFPLLEHATQISRNFEEKPGPASLSHGDAHPGNFFYEASDKIVTAIDTPTMDTSIGKRGPIGSPARDVVNFEIKLRTVGLGFQLTTKEITALQEAFRKTYESVGKREITTEATRFFQLRTLLSELKTAITDKKKVEIQRLVGEIKKL